MGASAGDDLPIMARRRNPFSPPFAIDLFAGAGGLSIGLQRAGCNVVGVELDEAACMTHRASVGPCVHADATSYHPDHEAVIVAGGSPCQSFSKAGKMRGLLDPRGVLFREIIRVGVEAHAQAIIIENVTGVLTTPAFLGSDETVVQRIRAEVEAAGFYSAQITIDAASFGVPQHRTRVFVLGFADSAALARYVLPEGMYGPSRWFPYVTVRQMTGDVPYDAPAPTVTTAEYKAALNLGSKGGKCRARHSLDRMVVAGRKSGQLVGRNLSIGEWAIIQGFPGGMPFSGNRNEQARQVGNAVPPALGEAVGRSVLRALGL
jgi:DNA (cytosine-5)-methyltransferase 1